MASKPIELIGVQGFVGRHNKVSHRPMFHLWTFERTLPTGRIPDSRSGWIWSWDIDCLPLFVTCVLLISSYPALHFHCRNKSSMSFGMVTCHVVIDPCEMFAICGNILSSYENRIHECPHANTNKSIRVRTKSRDPRIGHIANLRPRRHPLSIFNCQYQNRATMIESTNSSIGSTTSDPPFVPKNYSHCLSNKMWNFLRRTSSPQSLDDETNRTLFGKRNNPNGHGLNYK